MDKSLLNQFRLTMAEQHLELYGVRVEKKNGESVSHRWRSDDQENLYSGSKTFISVGIGICEDEGRLRVEDRALDFFPEYREIASEGSEKITIRDLLHMASGKIQKLFEGYTPQQIYGTDWAELFFRVPVTHEPGTFFSYSNPSTYLLGRIIEKVSGQTARDFLIPRLFTPLGIYNPQWRTCPRGHTEAAGGLMLTTEEYSRLGMLLLCGGEYRGRRVVGEGYVRRMSSDILKNSGSFPDTRAGYGYQVWLGAHPGCYRADGMYGQFCIVFPKEEAVVTVTGHEEDNVYRITQAVYEDILPGL